MSYTFSRFFENQPNEICSQRRQKACFLSPRSSKITVTKEIKGKEKKQGRGKGREKNEKKKAIVVLLVFIMATLELVFGQKTLSDVHLAIKFSKIRLNI